MYKYLSPSGEEHSQIPIIWKDGNLSRSLGGSWIIASGLGWTRVGKPTIHYDKLLVFDKLMSGGLGEVFVTFMNANLIVKLRWDAAPYLSTDDIDFMNGLSAFMTDCGLTKDAIDAMLESCILRRLD